MSLVHLHGESALARPGVGCVHPQEKMSGLLDVEPSTPSNQQGGRAVRVKPRQQRSFGRFGQRQIRRIRWSAVRAPGPALRVGRGRYFKNIAGLKVETGVGPGKSGRNLESQLSRGCGRLCVVWTGCKQHKYQQQCELCLFQLKESSREHRLILSRSATA